MDLRHIDLFSGVGGFALAAAWTGLCEGTPSRVRGGRSRDFAGAWDDFEWIECGDGKWRRAKSGVCGLAYGVPKGLLRGLGNAIVPQNAAVIMNAIREIEERGL